MMCQTNSTAHNDWLNAYTWLCHARRNAPVNADIWHLRFHWNTEGARLLQCVLEGQYRLSAMMLTGRGPNTQVQWCAQDALVLKWVALQVSSYLSVSTACRHVKGCGGIFQAVEEVAHVTRKHHFRFVYRTDIRGFYEHIRKESVLELFVSAGVPAHLLSLLEQYLFYTVERGDGFYTPSRGICRGAALSPMIAASLLYSVDEFFLRRTKPGRLYYARYMDDFLFLLSSRHELRRVVRYLKSYFDTEGFSQHPEKTQLGRISKGFDWLGIWFGHQGVNIAPRSLERYVENKRRLERIRDRRKREERIMNYEYHWLRWQRTMLGRVNYAEQN